MQVVLTAKRLREVLDYNPKTGVFTFCIKRGNRAKGTNALSRHRTGYIRVMVDGKRYLAHRLAWLWMKGRWPPEHMDHRNHIRTDNRWINLRKASWLENNKNRLLNRNNQSGFKGVSRVGKRWRAVIFAGQKQYHLGMFDTPELASAARNKKAQELHGEFATGGSNQDIFSWTHELPTAVQLPRL